MVKRKKRTSRNNPLFNKLSKKTKALIVAIVSSLFIGVLFGFISLQMAKEERLFEKTKVHSVNEQQEKQSEKEVQGASFYVIQGGVFSKSENAQNWSTQFVDAGFPAVIWEEEEQIYLFTGLSLSKDKANALAKKMTEKELDAYVKEWKVEPITTQATEKEHQFLQDFIQVWKASLTLIEENQNLPRTDWQKLMNDSNDVTENIRPLEEKIKNLLQEDNIEGSTFLLELIDRKSVV